MTGGALSIVAISLGTGTFGLVGAGLNAPVERNGLFGMSVTNGGTTDIDLLSLDGFSHILAGNTLGIVADQATYIAFFDSAVTIDTTNDVFVPANKPMLFVAMGRHLGLRSVTAGTANVRIWCK